MRLRQSGEQRDVEIELVERSGALVRATIDGREVSAQLERLADGSALLRAGGRRWRIAGGLRGDSILVAAGPLALQFQPVESRRSARHGGLATPEVTAPMPGKVLKILVAEGAEVNAGDPLVVLEAMKMETVLSAESPARIAKITVAEGQMVDHGAVLIELSPLADPSARQSGPPER